MQSVYLVERSEYDINGVLSFRTIEKVCGTAELAIAEMRDKATYFRNILVNPQVVADTADSIVLRGVHRNVILAVQERTVFQG